MGATEESTTQRRTPIVNSEPIRVFLSIVVLGLLTTACQGGGPSGPAFQVTDSAGVTVVTSTRPLWEDGESWVLSSEPEVVIGLRAGDERYLLTETVGLRRLSDGRIAILDAGSRQVRVYDGTGRHLLDLGRDGDGPGEFRTPQFLGVFSDTLFVFEYVGGDLTWFSPQGEFLRTSNIFPETEGARRTPVMLGYFEDRVGIGTRSAPIRPLPDGIVRQPRSIWRLGLSSTGVDSLLSAAGSEVEVFAAGSRGTGQRPYVFGKTTILTVSKNWLYVAPTDEFSIRVLDQEGELKRIIRRIQDPRRVSRGDIAQWVDEVIELRDPPQEERAEMRRTAGELKAAETMPAFRSIVADSEENLWVEEWEGVGWEQGRFSVFSPDGVWLGRVAVPDGLPWDRGGYDKQLIEIGPDYFLGVWTDDLGVEQVRLYRIEKKTGT